MKKILRIKSASKIRCVNPEIYGVRRHNMIMKMTPRARKIIADQGNTVTVRLEGHVCYG